MTFFFRILKNRERDRTFRIALAFLPTPVHRRFLKFSKDRKVPGNVRYFAILGQDRTFLDRTFLD
mgnify:CR=1 FL=1